MLSSWWKAAECIQSQFINWERLQGREGDDSSPLTLGLAQKSNCLHLQPDE